MSLLDLQARHVEVSDSPATCAHCKMVWQKAREALEAAASSEELSVDAVAEVWAILRLVALAQDAAHHEFHSRKQPDMPSA